MHIQVHLHDSLDFTGIVWVPRRCCVDPQKSENTVEKAVGRGRCGLAGGRRDGEEAGWNPFFLLSLHFQCVMEQWSYSPLPKRLCCGKEALLLLGSVADVWSSWIFFFSFFSSRPIHLSASWSWEHILCKKLSFREKSVLKEFSAYTHPCVWNCFTSVTSNT